MISCMVSWSMVVSMSDAEYLHLSVDVRLSYSSTQTVKNESNIGMNSLTVPCTLFIYTYNHTKIDIEMSTYEVFHFTGTYGIERMAPCNWNIRWPFEFLVSNYRTALVNIVFHPYVLQKNSSAAEMFTEYGNAPVTWCIMGYIITHLLMQYGTHRHLSYAHYDSPQSSSITLTFPHFEHQWIF